MGKPSLIGLRCAAQRLDVAPQELAVVGDDPELEMAMAHAVGALAIAVGTGIHPTDRHTDLPPGAQPAPHPRRSRPTPRTPARDSLTGPPVSRPSPAAVHRAPLPVDRGARPVPYTQFARRTPHSPVQHGPLRHPRPVAHRPGRLPDTAGRLDRRAVGRRSAAVRRAPGTPHTALRPA
ncbi:HAD hydrolase-like protein [Streptomyces sp. NPDC001868]|uniref:HAD hydrolase-like protein n=1 Tax=Streptomyces sp. NPDC001868 TaxID=3154401 RepID=UPI00332528C0